MECSEMAETLVACLGSGGGAPRPMGGRITGAAGTGAISTGSITPPRFACGYTAQVPSAVSGPVLGKAIGANST